MKTITVYTRNYPYRTYNGKWEQLQTKYLFNPERDANDFEEHNIEALREILEQRHAEEYTGTDDNMIDDYERYEEWNMPEFACEEFVEAQDAYDSDDWGYRTPEGEEYEEMVAMNNARNQANQERYRHLYTHELV